MTLCSWLVLSHLGAWQIKMRVKHLVGGVHSEKLHSSCESGFPEQESANNSVDRTDDGEMLARRFRTIQETGDRTTG